MDTTARVRYPAKERMGISTPQELVHDRHRLQIDSLRGAPDMDPSHILEQVWKRRFWWAVPLILLLLGLAIFLFLGEDSASSSLYTHF